MKNKYLKSMTAHVIMVMLSVLCLTGAQAIGAQNRNMGGGSPSGGSSAANASSSQKPIMPLMTRSTSNAVSVNETEYATWADAVTAINESSEENFDIVLINHVMDAKTMPSKPCTISGKTTDINFTYIDDNSYLTRIQMSAPVTFKNITLQVWQIAANGHALTFDEGVTVASGYTIDNAKNTGIRNIWGGTDNNSNVENTNITIKSGQFGWVTGGSTTSGDDPANSGDVTGTSTVTIIGGTINGTVFGGGYGGTCDNTIVNMSGGTTGWIYGGGEVGDVTDTAKLTISGTAVVKETVFGGSDSGTCGSTEVKLNGGTFKGNIYTGGFHGIVAGLSSIIVDGAKIDPEQESGSPNIYMGGSIYGGGFGDFNSEDDKGKVDSATVLIKGLKEGSHHVNVFGGGLTSSVTGNTSVTIEGGTIDAAWGSGYNYNGNKGSVKGNASIVIKDGTIKTVGAARGQMKDKPIAVEGKLSISIEGGSVIESIMSGNEPHGSEYKDCTLTLKGIGSENQPYNLPQIRGINNLVLDNTIATCRGSIQTEGGSYNLGGFAFNEDNPIHISGDGKLVGRDILLQTMDLGALPPNIPLVVTGNLPKTTTFAGLVRLESGITPVTTLIYKAGHTYRLKKADETLYTVGIATPETEGIGTISVKWDQYAATDVMLEDGDQVPNTANITPTATPNDEGITATLKNGETTITNGSALTLSADASFQGEFEIQPLDLDKKNEDITISKDGNIWKYMKAAITRSTPSLLSFNGTIKNTLADTKRMLIDETAQGVLTFENAKINSSTTAAPALTIANGAKVSFRGNLEVKAGEANQYGISNNGSLTITGKNTEITATNTTTDSDKGIKVNLQASMVAEANTKLTTSGMENIGTVVVKEGATAETTTQQPLQKTYLVTVLDPGNGNELVLTTGTDITVSNQDKVASNTILTVSGIPASGYALESITATPKSGQAATLSNNSTYTMPESPVAFSATFKQQITPPEPPATVYYNVTLPVVEGAVTDPVAGAYEVESWGSFRFYLSLDKEYDQSVPLVTTSRGETITPRTSDGAYIIEYVRQPLDIFIDGIVKNPDPVANETLATVPATVRVFGNALSITVPQATTAIIFDLAGRPQRNLRLPDGETRVEGLPSGAYIVKFENGEVVKVIVTRSRT